MILKLASAVARAAENTMNKAANLALLQRVAVHNIDFYHTLGLTHALCAAELSRRWGPEAGRRLLEALPACDLPEPDLPNLEPGERKIRQLAGAAALLGLLRGAAPYYRAMLVSMLRQIEADGGPDALARVFGPAPGAACDLWPEWLLGPHPCVPDAQTGGLRVADPKGRADAPN